MSHLLHAFWVPWEDRRPLELELEVVVGHIDAGQQVQPLYKSSE